MRIFQLKLQENLILTRCWVGRSLSFAHQGRFNLLVACWRLKGGWINWVGGEMGALQGRFQQDRA